MGEAARDATTVGENDAMDLSAGLAAYDRVALNLDKLDWSGGGCDEILRRAFASETAVIRGGASRPR